MKNTYITIIITAFFLTLLSSSSSPVQAQATAGKPHLSQTYVDTTVMRAIYVLNEASANYAVNATKQNVAVTRARAILDDLKRKAKGDPNERYALMKIREVEAQIYLEEEEMRTIAHNTRVLSANKIVIDYNFEVAKTRPDFATLRGLFRQMAEVDTRQANNLANSYNKRYRQISREAQFSLEKALAANDTALARSELEYCERNKFYLMLNSSHLEKQRARYERIVTALSDVPKITVELDAGEKAYNEFNLSSSRTSLTMARARINNATPFMPVKDAQALSARGNRLLKALDTREDSLVRVAMNTLNQRGADAAIKYLREELQEKFNLSSEYTALIDKAILAKSPEHTASSGGAANADVALISSLTSSNDADASYSMLLGMESKARQRAQEKADSLMAVRSKANAISINIYTMLEQNKIKDATRLFNKEKKYLASMMDKNAYDMLELSVTYSAKNPPAKNSHAKSGSGSGKNASASVISDVGVVSVAPPPTQQPQQASQNSADKNLEKALDVERRLYALVEKNEIAEAHKRFQENRRPLQKYLSKDAFEMLEFTIVQSYNYVTQN